MRIDWIETGLWSPKPQHIWFAFLPKIRLKFVPHHWTKLAITDCLPHAMRKQFYVVNNMPQIPLTELLYYLHLKCYLSDSLRLLERDVCDSPDTCIDVEIPWALLQNQIRLQRRKHQHQVSHTPDKLFQTILSNQACVWAYRHIRMVVYGDGVRGHPHVFY